MCTVMTIRYVIVERALKDSFNAHWPTFEGALEETKKSPPKTEKVKKRDTNELLEEVLVGIRDLQNRALPDLAPNPLAAFYSAKTRPSIDSIQRWLEFAATPTDKAVIRALADSMLECVPEHGAAPV